MASWKPSVEVKDSPEIKFCSVPDLLRLPPDLAHDQSRFEERYQSREGFFAKCKQPVNSMVQQRFLLLEDGEFRHEKDILSC
jgi:hypothetical protein